MAAYKLRYMCLWSSSDSESGVEIQNGVPESAILNFYLRSGRTIFPMCHLDRILKVLSNDVLTTPPRYATL